MDVQALINIIASIATITAAGGVWYAARQSSLVLQQLIQAKDIQAVSLHTGFQKEFREWQKSLPSEVTDRNWIPRTPDEKRHLQLYWELVFDEWYTCTKVSKEPNVIRLWESYSYGVMGAMSRSAFVDTLTETLSKPTYYFGHGEEFRDVMSKLFERANQDNQAPFKIKIENTSTPAIQPH